VSESEPGEREQQSAAPQECAALRCDTCGRPSTVVSRVVIDQGYDRSNARPLWNCPECYEKKEQLRKQAT
jgi:hypothetical protein